LFLNGNIIVKMSLAEGMKDVLRIFGVERDGDKWQGLYDLHTGKKISEILINLKIQGATILLIEHDMNFVMDMADEIYVLDIGQNN